MRGSVNMFDDAKGYGTVCSDAGSEFFFHCTSIADGSRTIDVGALIEFDLVPGHLGRYEASRLRRASS